MKKIILLVIFSFINIAINAQIGEYALKFDGVNDYISVPNNSSLEFTAFTVEMWVYLQDGINDNKLIGKTLPNTHQLGFNFGVGQQKLSAEVFGGDDSHKAQAISTELVPLNKWTHIAMSWKSGESIKAYINGVEVASGASGTFDINTNNVLIIGMAPWNNLNEKHFKGKMDEIRIWNVVRTSEEIKANMYKEIGTHSNLKAYYKMSDGSGTTLSDNSGTGNNGSFVDQPTWVASGCFAGSRNALNFDGTDDCVTMPQSFNDGFDNLQHFSFCGWVYCSTLEPAGNWGTFLHHIIVL